MGKVFVFLIMSILLAGCQKVESGVLTPEKNPIPALREVLVVRTLSTPIASNIIAGTRDVLVAVAVLDATGSDKDILVQMLGVTNTPAAGARANDLAIGLWADLNAAESSRGDAYETSLGSPVYFQETLTNTADQLIFSIKTIRVPAGKFISVAAVGAVAPYARGIYVVRFSAIAAIDAESGKDIIPIFTGAGQAMTIAPVTIGTVMITEDGMVVDSQPRVGDKAVVVNSFKLVVGSVEGIAGQISVMKTGSAILSDAKNIELIDVSRGQSLGVTQWDSNGFASWGNIFLQKGETRRFRVQLDIVGGSGRTINADLVDGTHVLLFVQGTTYGFPLTPVLGSWSGPDSGQGANDQTIQ